MPDFIRQMMSAGMFPSGFPAEVFCQQGGGLSAEQQAEIKRLRNEINRLSMFRSTVRNYQEQASDEHEVNPADMLAVSYNNE